MTRRANITTGALTCTTIQTPAAIIQTAQTTGLTCGASPEVCTFTCCGGALRLDTIITTSQVFTCGLDHRLDCGRSQRAVPVVSQPIAEQRGVAQKSSGVNASSTHSH